MASLTIIPTFEVVEDRDPGRISGCPVAPLDQLPFERREETLDDSVIVTVRSPRHTRSDVVLSEQDLIVKCRILHPAVSVMQQPMAWAPRLERHLQRRADSSRAWQSYISIGYKFW
jgi:hypothetical protein